MAGCALQLRRRRRVGAAISRHIVLRQTSQHIHSAVLNAFLNAFGAEPALVAKRTANSNSTTSSTPGVVGWQTTSVLPRHAGAAHALVGSTICSSRWTSANRTVTAKRPTSGRSQSASRWQRLQPQRRRPPCCLRRLGQHNWNSLRVAPRHNPQRWRTTSRASLTGEPRHASLQEPHRLAVTQIGRSR